MSFKCTLSAYGVRFLQQREVVSRIHQHTDPLAADRRNETHQFLRGVILVVLDGEPKTMLFQNAFDEGQRAFALCMKACERLQR